MHSVTDQFSSILVGMRPDAAVRPVTRRRTAESGSTLAVTLILAAVVMIVLEGFLVLLNHEYKMVYRTCDFDNALQIAEAGLEEGVAMMLYGSGNWAANGWSSMGSDYTKASSSLVSSIDGKSLGTYSVTITSPSGSSPQITSVGVVTNVALGAVLSRTVRITLASSGLFNWSLRAKGQISLSGNAEVDSYDSSNSSYSDYNLALGYGTYNSSKRKDNGDLATNGNTAGTISLNGNAGIYGNVNTGTSGTVTGNGNAFVGWLTNAPNGVIQSGRVSHSSNMDFPDRSVPFTGSTSLGSYSKSGNRSGTIVGGIGETPVDYTASSFSTSGNATITVTGYARIYVTGHLSTSGNGGIIVTPGSKVEFYVDGSVSVTGNGIQNQAGTAEKFQLYSLGNSSVSISGNGDLTGAIYAPNSAISISGNGDLFGAVVGNTISVSGNGNIHYDEALKKVTGSSDLAIAGWQEL